VHLKPLVVVALFAMLVGGCATTPESVVLDDASDGLNCPEAQCKIIEMGVSSETDRVYRVFGCGHEAAYHCALATTGRSQSWKCTRTA
jgi:hypothetical protein